MWIFVYIFINEFYLLCRIFYLLSYVPEIFFLSYSFVMFRIDFLLRIWVNLHIYNDIVFVGLVFWLKFLLIIFFYCTWQIKLLYYFGENQSCNMIILYKINLNFNQSISNYFFILYIVDNMIKLNKFGMLYINLLNLVWF